ncbi:MAG: glycoside hydrolase family 13 protein [Clostridiales bacterium]|jgi:glycosidase|nr:glycoside hydrolase family 13 protein [Clostridiales bacterium]
MIYFDPLSLPHKSPSGAIVLGQTLRLKLRLPRAFAAREAAFLLQKDGEGRVAYPLRWTGIEKGADEWETEITITSIGLYFYRFLARGRWDMDLGANAFFGAEGGGDFVQLVTEPADCPRGWGGGVMYQIFCDRFAVGAGGPIRAKPDCQYRDDWGGAPKFLPDADGEVRNDDFFGGNLFGAAEKLDYLKALGVTALYLNPIFEAASNHKYDTGDYFRVDPLFGGLPAFRALCAAARERNIKIILDGVFNHTGADSRYFNRYGRYDSLGAYQSPDSPYYEWFTFARYPDKYDAWWGFKTLPAVKKDSPSFSEFINGANADGVGACCLKEGANGVGAHRLKECADGVGAYRLKECEDNVGARRPKEGANGVGAYRLKECEDNVGARGLKEDADGVGARCLKECAGGVGARGLKEDADSVGARRPEECADGVAAYWLKQGADGWRLDVADELSDGFLESLRARVKSVKPDALLVGEVWENAAVKTAYGARRKYFLGKQLDSVMNYPFRAAIIEFARDGNSAGLAAAVREILDCYPAGAVRNLMNSLSTHDTPRALTVFEGDVSKLRLAAVLQYTLPGFPCVFYGDEAGMSGGRDPFCRGCYPWGLENAALIEHYTFLGKLRATNKAFDGGGFRLLREGGGVFIFERQAMRNTECSAQCTVHSPQLKDNSQCTMHNAQCFGHFSLSKPVTESPSKENSPAKKEMSVEALSSGCSEIHEAQSNSQFTMYNAQLIDGEQGAGNRFRNNSNKGGRQVIARSAERATRQSRPNPGGSVVIALNASPRPFDVETGRPLLDLRTGKKADGDIAIPPMDFAVYRV